jgi:hypothetical protein
MEPDDALQNIASQLAVMFIKERLEAGGTLTFASDDAPPPPRFTMEAWPTGTRARALRHALHYRAEARAWQHRATAAWRAQDAAMREAWRAQERSAELFRRVVELEEALRAHRRDTAAGCQVDAALWAALGEGEA